MTTRPLFAGCPSLAFVACAMALAGAAPGCSIGEKAAAGATTADAAALDVTQQVELPGASSESAAQLACPGGHGCPCTADGDCKYSGLCVLNADGNSQCALPCPSSACPDGQTCRTIGAAGKTAPFCVPKFGRLCDPCASSADCASPGHPAAVCVDYGAMGRFCGVSCLGNSDCQAGYECRQVSSADAGVSRQCVKVDGGQLGVCGCSARAVAQKLETVCGVGSCKGKRACGDGGLSACDGKAAAAETCDGLDNDCDGQTDEPANGIALCGDNNPCTADSCDPAKGCQNLPADGTACNADGSLCTVGDACKAGVCTAGPAPDCDDGNPCTDDACAPTSGCTHAAAAKTCDDKDPCTEADKCAAGVCAGTPKACDDKNPCTADVCLAGACTGTAVDGAPCSDGDACTGADTCLAGKCTGTKATCDDANPCTADSCDPKGGCANLPADPTACNDGNPCTSGEKCANGVCGGGKIANCLSDNPCLLGFCAPATGQCALKLRPDGASCNDGMACTANDACSKGICAGALACDDSNACTDDACSPTGDCTHTAKASGKCDDGDKCTSGDACAAGKCSGSPSVTVCDDKNVCTADTCDAKTGCAHLATGDGTACDDSLACNGADTCKAGQCSQHAAACKSCAKDADCASEDDGNVCNGKVICLAGTCGLDAKSVVVCDPTADTACKVNTCDAKTGSCTPQGLPDGATCTDGNACTANDACKAGACVATGGCDDGNSCTKDDCVSAKCDHPAQTGSKCDDGDACSTADQCGADGACAGTKTDCDDKNACTTDSCDAKSGSCGHAALDAGTCDDGSACTSNDACSKGACVGTAKVCDDKNSCTVDSCDKATGNCATALAQDGTACDDGSACTADDKCVAGSCKGAIGADLVSTLAGNATAGFANGTGAQAKFAEPVALAVDASGNLYVCDAAEGAARIRKVTPLGEVTTFAGQGLSGFADGAANTARFWRPSGIAFDDKGNLFVADRYNQRIRKIDASGNVSTVAGSADAPGFGDPKALGDFADGVGAAAKFDEPSGIAWSAADSAFFVVEAANNCVRKVSTDGTVTLVAGKAGIGSADGPALKAKFSAPTGIAVDSSGNVYVADTGNHTIRKISGGMVTTVAGTPGSAGYKDAVPADSLFSSPAGLWAAGSLIYVADSGNGAIRSLAFSEVLTLAGTGKVGFADGEFAKAQFQAPRGVVAAGAGLWYVADAESFRVRKLFSPKFACPK